MQNIDSVCVLCGKQVKNINFEQMEDTYYKFLSNHVFSIELHIIIYVNNHSDEDSILLLHGSINLTQNSDETCKNIFNLT